MANFAKAELLKYGWTEGKGLGKNESGITEAIKPKLKFDNAGIGHDSAEQFTYHWWENVFNTAAKNISVDSDAHGVSVKVIDEDTVDITTKKSSLKALKKHNKLHYNNFLKTSTLLNDGKFINENGDDLENTYTLEKKIDFTQLTDEDLFKACGGRTAHKGARHGLNLNGKLARIAEQEKQLLLKMNLGKAEDITHDGFEIVKSRKRTKSKKKNSKDVEGTVNCATTQPSCSYGIGPDTEGTALNVSRSKLKAKRRNKTDGNLTNSSQELSSVPNPTVSEECPKESDVTEAYESMLDRNANAVEQDSEVLNSAAAREPKQRTKSKKTKRKEKRMINDLTEQLDTTCTIDESTETLRKQRKLESKRIIEDVLTTALEICSPSVKESKKQDKKKNESSEACEYHKLNKKISKKKKHAYQKKQRDKLKRITKDLMLVDLDKNPVKQVIEKKKEKKKTRKQRHPPDDGTQ